MSELPRLETVRLWLRSFELTDASEVQRLAGDRLIAATTLNIPHPYPDGAAEEWLRRSAERAAAGESLNYAIERRSDSALVGSVALSIEPEHNRAELGYWIGVPYWGQGYATEAAGELVRYGLETLGLNRIYAYHFPSNPASGRVLQKIGMAYEGRRRQHSLKWGEYLDSESYAILRSDAPA